MKEKEKTTPLLVQLMASPAFDLEHFLTLLTESKTSRLLVTQIDSRAVIDKTVLLEFIGEQELTFPCGRLGRLFTLFWVAIFITLAVALFFNNINIREMTFWGILLLPIITFGIFAWRNDGKIIYVNKSGIGEKKSTLFIPWSENIEVKWNYVHFSLLINQPSNNHPLRIPRDINDFSFLHAILSIMSTKCPKYTIGATYKNEELFIANI